MNSSSIAPPVNRSYSSRLAYRLWLLVGTSNIVLATIIIFALVSANPDFTTAQIILASIVGIAIFSYIETEVILRFLESTRW